MRPAGAPEAVARWVAALEAERNAARATIQRRLVGGDARTKLRKLYPEPLSRLD